MKQDTAIVSISHCIKLIVAVCMGFIYKQFKKYEKQTALSTLLHHMFMDDPQVIKFLAF
jgi:hypothetical protein